MKAINILKSICALGAVALWAGCHYEAPLADPMGLPLDTSILGTWTKLDKHGEIGPKADRIIIYPFRKDEYLVIDPGRETLYFRAYPIRLAGQLCVQMQQLENPDKARHSTNKPKEDFKPYMVIRYERQDGRLLVHLLNKDLISDEHRTQEALVEAFHKHADSPLLFSQPEVYIR